MKGRAMRLLAGLGVVMAVLIVAFSALPVWVHSWGATGEEIVRTMPGDELTPKPAVLWNHGITIEAAPEAIWPWIAQLGDTRGGFYSFTFIENCVAGGDIYHNASRILPEYQHPRPGESLIGGVMEVKDSRPGEWLLGYSPTGDVGWTWVWALYPAERGQTRLVVRSRIQPAGADIPALVTLFIDLGGFAMEKRMMQGIKDRSEGRIDPPYQEALEVSLWLICLGAGLTAGLMFIFRWEGRQYLAIGVASMLVLVGLVFAQPGVLAGTLLDAGLVAWLLAAILREGAPAPTPALARTA